MGLYFWNNEIDAKGNHSPHGRTSWDAGKLLDQAIEDLRFNEAGWAIASLMTAEQRFKWVRRKAVITAYEVFCFDYYSSFKLRQGLKILLGDKA